MSCEIIHLQMLPDLLQCYVCSWFFQILCVNEDNVAVNWSDFSSRFSMIFFPSPKHLLTLIFNSFKRIRLQCQIIFILYQFSALTYCQLNCYFCHFQLCVVAFSKRQAFSCFYCISRLFQTFSDRGNIRVITQTVRHSTLFNLPAMWKRSR